MEIKEIKEVRYYNTEVKRPDYIEQYNLFNKCIFFMWSIKPVKLFLDDMMDTVAVWKIKYK